MNEADVYNVDPLFRHLFKPEKPVRHQKTCPACGRTLVNLYRRDGVWKCRRCWKEALP
jgi:ribosomal protein L37AE/L43A